MQDTLRVNVLVALEVPKNSSSSPVVNRPALGDSPVSSGSDTELMNLDVARLRMRKGILGKMR